MGIIRKEDVHSSFDDYIKEVVDYDSTITSLNDNTQDINNLQTSKQDKIEDSGWQTLPLGIATIRTIEPQYRKIGNELALKGYFVGITSASDLVGTLPSGNRPVSNTFIPILSDNFQIAKLRINNNGTIYVGYDENNYASGTVYSLDGISFKIG